MDFVLKCLTFKCSLSTIPRQLLVCILLKRVFCFKLTTSIYLLKRHAKNKATARSQVD